MTPKNLGFREATAGALADQPFAELLGLQAGEITEGVFELTFQSAERHLQHDGFVHGGVIASVADTCLALAAHTLVAFGERVLTVEFKINFLRPARGEETIRCRGEVVRPGKTITVSEAKVFATAADSSERLIATASGTIATVG